MDQSRRQFLKIMAAAPLILPFGLTVSPVMRFLKPTMGPLGYFDPADQPGCAEVLSFSLYDFPQPWTCIPFMFPLKITEFSPEQQDIREIPGFIIRTPENKIVAYSRVCPAHPTHICILNWADDPSIFGCAPALDSRFAKVHNPVLWCACKMITFDVADDLRVIRGSSPRLPTKFDLERRGKMITIIRPEPGAIL